MKTIKILHQIDKHNGKIENEFWTVDGINYADGKELKSKGFNWISGPDGGAWQAPNMEALLPLINAGVEVANTGNGHS